MAIIKKECASILLVTPESGMGREVGAFLDACGHDVEWVDTQEKAFNRLDTRSFDALVCQLYSRRGAVDGLRLMRVAMERNSDVCVILIAEPSEVETATEAMRSGASDFQTRPLNLAKLDAVVQREIGRQRLLLEQYTLRRRLDEHYGLDKLIGRSRRILQVYNQARMLATTDRPVLIHGEPGTGKDVLAQAIHNNSPRRNEAFVKVDCEATPRDAHEVELFGVRERRSRVDLADRGTLYLDRVEFLPLPLQERIAELASDGRFARAGDGVHTKSDVRLILSLGMASEKALEQGVFSSNLQVLFGDSVIETPSLRSRSEDIPFLAEHFLQQGALARGRSVPAFTARAMDTLERYDWPGNIRELAYTVDTMLASCREGGVLDVYDVPAHICVAPLGGEIKIPRGTSADDAERILITETMRDCGYQKERCAAVLGIGLRTLYRKLTQYGLHVEKSEKDTAQ
jgi:DNA-binding NtrC family response regulator